jgi:hypothetical protein
MELKKINQTHNGNFIHGIRTYAFEISCFFDSHGNFPMNMKKLGLNLNSFQVTVFFDKF